MAGEWIDAVLEQIAARTDRPFAMGPFGSNIKAENYRDTGVPVIRGTNLCEAGGAPFVTDNFAFLDKAKAHELASSSCGLCGKASIDSVQQHFPPVNSLVTVTARNLASLPEQMRNASRET